MRFVEFHPFCKERKMDGTPGLLYDLRMRLFIGIPLAVAVRGELSALAAGLKSRDDGLRWTAPESWHITLEFLGNTGPEQYECVAARLGELHLPSVPIALERLEFFARAGILIVAVRPAPQLLLLQQRVSAAAGLCGFTPETRPYQPHITLARSKGKGRSQESTEQKIKIHRQPAFTSYLAEEFLLYESFLGAAGSCYEVRKHFPLQGRS
jgi:2'-5' RNA ligase